MTTRRQVLVAGSLGAIAPAALAQLKPVRIGILGPVPLARSVWGPPLVQRLGELGYRDGIEYRSSQGVEDNYLKQARELVELKCNVIFPLGSETPARALRDARTTIPVVFLAVDYDPLEKRIVSSLARPEGNITGVYVPQGALVAKRIEILREVTPKARRFLLFADVFSKDQVAPARGAAKAAGVELTVVEFSTPPYEFAAGFDAGRKAQVEGFIGLASPVFAASREEVSALLLKHRLPAVASTMVQADAGYLFSLGPHVAKTAGRAAEIGVRILKGARPAEIPVEQADEFELAVNAKTAKALGVKVPESVMARATRIVQ